MAIDTGKFKDLGLESDGTIQTALLTAIARSAEDLTNGRGWPDGVNALLANLGKITGVSRVWIFQTLELTDQFIVQDYTFEWASAPKYVQIGLPYFSRFKKAVNQPEYRDLIQSRLRGEYQKVITCDLQPCWLRSSQEQQNIKSMLTIPINVENKWWGTLGFDDCEREYDWSDSEIALLRTAGFLISSAVLRDSLSAKRKQLDILQKITACSAWQFDLRRWQIWCTSEIFGSVPGKTSSLQFSFRSFLKMIHQDHRKRFLYRVKQHARDWAGKFRCDIKLLMECGDYRWVELTGNIDNESGGRRQQLAGIALDITFRKDAEERLRQEATTDPLTGVLNRRKLELILREHVDSRTATREIFSLLMLDLDHFKKINDTYGHAVGDKILCHFVGICQKCLRKKDHLARVGGEEFAILLPETEEKAAFDIGNRIRDKLKSNPFSHAGKRIPITVSIGCASLADDFMEAAKLYSLADYALYRAKNTGRDKVACPQKLACDRLSG
jgi:two-component system, cell cycle response regulator